MAYSERRLPEVKYWKWYGKCLYEDEGSETAKKFQAESKARYIYRQAIRKIKKSKGVNQ